MGYGYIIARIPPNSQEMEEMEMSKNIDLIRLSDDGHLFIDGSVLKYLDAETLSCLYKICRKTISLLRMKGEISDEKQ